MTPVIAPPSQHPWARGAKQYPNISARCPPCRTITHHHVEANLELMLRLGPNIDKETLASVLSFSHTLVTSIESLVLLLNQVSMLDVHETITKLYPYKLILPKDSQWRTLCRHSTSVRARASS